MPSDKHVIDTLLASAQAGARHELARRELARNDLLAFTEYTFPNYAVGAHHKIIAEKLNAVERGEIRRLMIFCPPRHGKSELSSRRFPAYCLGRDPNREIISASYGSDLAKDFGREVRNIVGGPEFKALYPKVSLAADSAAKDRWHTNRPHRGGYIAAGVNTAVTGRGAEIFVIDDPVKDRQDAESELIRESTWSWYRAVVYTRLAPAAAIVLIMTRWHEDDLAGRLLNAGETEGDKWDVVNMPAFNADGGALWPEKFTADDLHRIRRVLELREWGALYEQNPRPTGSSFFDLDKLLVLSRPVLDPIKCQSVFAVMDTAVKTGSKNDGSAVIYYAYDPHLGNRLTVLDWEIQQIQGASLDQWIPAIYRRLEEFAGSCGARMGSGGIYIEDKASGMVLLQQMKKHPSWNAHAIVSKLTAMGKDERAMNASRYVHTDKVKMTHRAYDKVCTYKSRVGNHFLTQVGRFQLGVDSGADDLLDCFTYGVMLACGSRDGF